MTPTPASTAPAAASGDSHESEQPTWRSADLFQGTREVLINHEGEVYRLRLTRNGKLILHK